MRIRRFIKFIGMRIAMAGMLAAALSACHSIDLRSDPKFNPGRFAVDPPRSLAILPVTDESDHPDLLPLLRTDLFASTSLLPYQGRDLRAVDEFLASKAARRGTAPDKLTSAELIDPALADCVIFTRLVSVSRLYLIFYAHYRFDLDLEMADTRTRQVFYRNHFVFYDRLTTPSYITLLGVYAFAAVAESGVESLIHLSSKRLEESCDAGAKEIAKVLPVPGYVAVSSGGTLRLDSVQVVKPFPVLGAGNRVIVKVRGTPGCRASFDIGKLAREEPLREATPGSYLGMYTVKDGDNVDYALVEIHMAARKGTEHVEYAATGDSFAIKTTLPPRAHVIAVERRLFRSGVILRLEINPGEAGKNREKPLSYQVYRKIPGSEKYNRVGTTRKTWIEDPDARRGQTEEYYVVTCDEAGNVSPIWGTQRVAIP